MITSESVAFRYPPVPATRRHGPGGYRDYSSYRGWLRDEFKFRCVYCLSREQWGRVTGEFDLDHFLPQVLATEHAEEYDNLLYCCHTCNLRKGDQTIASPVQVLSQGTVRLLPDGQLEGLLPETRSLILKLGLNSTHMIRWRWTWMQIIELAREHDFHLYQQLMGFPEHLPDLRRARPPVNSRPEGIQESWLLRKRRGELSETYLY